MTKQEMVNEIALKADIGAPAALKALDAVTQIITDEMIKNDKITLHGFGTFQKKFRAARVANSPHGGKVDVPEKYVPTFRASKLLKETIMGAK